MEQCILNTGLWRICVILEVKIKKNIIVFPGEGIVYERLGRAERFLKYYKLKVQSKLNAGFR